MSQQCLTSDERARDGSPDPHQAAVAPERASDPLDQQLAAPMFVATMLFLLLLAGALHLHDLPSLAAAHRICELGLLAVLPLFLAEAVVRCVRRNPRWKQYLLFSLLPPLRLAARDQATGSRVWLPRLGWQVADRTLYTRVERDLSVPMMLIALTVLPVFAIEHFWAEQVRTVPWLAWVTQAGTGLIWVAFTIEFLLMVAVTNNRFKYCREHWLDLIVICLPIVAWLRVARLGSLLRMQQVVKTTRMYRLRLLAMRVYRAALLLKLIERLLRPNPARRLNALRQTLADREREIADLRAEIAALEASLAARSQPDELPQPQSLNTEPAPQVLSLGRAA